MEIDPPFQSIVSQNRPSVSQDLERNTPVLSRVLFQSEDVIEVEELPESPKTPSSPPPLDYPYVLLYVGTLNHKPLSPGLHQYFPSMTTTGSMVSTLGATIVNTPFSV